LLARKVKTGGIVCLSGDLGSGKTTFTQGLLKGLKVKGPYTSPTFVVMKEYHITCNIKHKTKNKKTFHAPCSMFHAVYHIDAYRVNSKDILDLSWEEIIASPQNIVIIEWADRIRDIIPKGSLWIEFEWVDKNERKIKFIG
jgi:tRNA threonylcarbamoyladenosine biosynthesis protein TsaE